MIDDTVPLPVHTVDHMNSVAGPDMRSTQECRSVLYAITTSALVGTTTLAYNSW